MDYGVKYIYPAPPPVAVLLVTMWLDEITMDSVRVRVERLTLDDVIGDNVSYLCRFIHISIKTPAANR